MYIFGVGLGCFRPAGDPRETREKYTTNGNKGNLNNRTVLAEERGVPVYQCTSRFYKLTRARTYMVLENDWHTGTVVSEERESDNPASVFWGCLLPYKTHASREWRGIKNLARAMPLQRKRGFIRRIVGGVRVRKGKPLR